ncbi:MAG: hypothetical protein GY930_00705 [bacterium]|nr:hypothetical protein [bacterium]
MAFLLAQHFEKEGFGEQAFHGATTIHPAALILVLVLIALTLIVKRNKAVYPIIFAACFLPAAQRLVIVGADFSMLRLLILAGMLRVFFKGEVKNYQWIKLDTLVTAWCVISALAYIVLWGSMGQFIFRVGQLYDILGLYLYFRVVIRKWGDVEGAVRFTILLTPVLLALFFLEKQTGKNPFHFLGAQEWATIRHFRVRCQGPFPHAILAGTYFAAVLPMALALFFRPKGKAFVIRSLIGVMGLVYLCASSTPLVGVTAGFLGLAGWTLRYRMALIRMGTVAALFALHMVMEASVWHLISRMSFSKGNTAYHRFLLIDNSIRYFTEWAAIGVKGTAHWGHAMGDLTNQFVREGARGGFLSLIFFCWALAEGFSLCGKLWRRVRRNKVKRYMVWGLGTALFAHCLMFLSISITHSQQNMSLFFFILASLGSLSLLGKKTKRKRKGPRSMAMNSNRPQDELQEEAA